MGRYLLNIICFICIFSQSALAQVEVKNNSFYIDGQKFFIKGIGYEVGAMPGEIPYARTFKPDQLRYDIQRILSGGFNTIRTWGSFTKQELDILKEYNIKIIMGIWIDPAGSFSNAQFVSNSKAIVNSVLSYSKNYNNIIGYLIMNEPQPAAIFGAGFQNTINLWKQLIDIIHIKHPNRPVSIANTPSGTNIESSLFDFSAYNVYIYNPIMVNYVHEYRDYVKYLQQINSSDHPLIITEFGLSVSPTGTGNWGYGGNSVTQQQQGDLYMYKSIVDGGANGACIFNYSDGWYKSGNEFSHSDLPEEWFGLIEYASATDKQGKERPVWKAVKDYQSAIITQPKSGEIYLNKVPIEVFLNDTIKKIDILLENNLVYQKQIVNTYLSDTLIIDFQNIKDAKLVFNCYDSNDTLIKSEEKSILLTSTELILPTIQITANSDCWQTGTVKVNYKIIKSVNFTNSSILNYAYYPHVGFDYGQKFSSVMADVDSLNVAKQHVISSGVNVITLGAAFNISYNGFQKRIFSQLTLTKNFSTNIKAGKTAKITIFPNPATGYFSVSSDDAVSSTNFDYTIFNNLGMLVKKSTGTWGQLINIDKLQSGIYNVQIISNSNSAPINKKILKL